MNRAAEFYALRDLRTLDCGGDAGALGQPVGIKLGKKAASTRWGQLTALALLNMAARVHRSVVLDLPDEPLLVRGVTGQKTLRGEAIHLASRIDPFGRFALQDSVGPETPSVAIGDACGSWRVGEEEGQVLLCTGRHHAGNLASPRNILTSGFAACLGAAALFKAVHGLPVPNISIPGWDADGLRVDVGSVAVIGAGAVGSALAYWLHESSFCGDWVFVDGDLVKLHNTNRGLLFFPSDTDFFGDKPQPKASCVAERIGAAHHDGWYEEWATRGDRPDLILPLANERGVRAIIGQRGEPLLIHATTSRTWEAQLHRHVPLRDDCITCRMSAAEEEPDFRFACSTGVMPATAPGSKPADSALPFLSAASGLLLLAGLQQLQNGHLTAGEANFWRINFRALNRPYRAARARCREGCMTAMPAQVLDRLNRGRRWAC